MMYLVIRKDNSNNMSLYYALTVCSNYDYLQGCICVISAHTGRRI